VGSGELARVVRLGAVPFAIFQVALGTGYSPHYEFFAWLTTGVFAAGAIAFSGAHVLSRRRSTSTKRSIPRKRSC
jgi:hypothetical protein